jgi:hypothetical protein
VEKQNQPLVRLADPADVVAGLQLVTLEYAEGATRPTARTGSIARTTPALIANAGPSDGIPGAPALTVDGGEVAGVVSLHQSNLATDLLAPVSAIAAELDKNKVHNDLAPVDQHYRAGLDAYYDGRYTDAVESFDAVLAIVPSHVQAHEFRDKAQGLREAEGADRSPDVSLLSVVKGWLGGAIGSLAAAAVIAGLGLVLVRRRHGHPPARRGAPADPPRHPDVLPQLQQRPARRGGRLPPLRSARPHALTCAAHARGRGLTPYKLIFSPRDERRSTRITWRSMRVERRSLRSGTQEVSPTTLKERRRSIASSVAPTENTNVMPSDTASETSAFSTATARSGRRR